MQPTRVVILKMSQSLNRIRKLCSCVFCIVAQCWCCGPEGLKTAASTIDSVCVTPFKCLTCWSVTVLGWHKCETVENGPFCFPLESWAVLYQIWNFWFYPKWWHCEQRVVLVLTGSVFGMIMQKQMHKRAGTPGCEYFCNSIVGRNFPKKSVMTKNVALI